MVNLLPILNDVEFERINGAEWLILIDGVVHGQLYAEHFDADGYADDSDDLKGMYVEDLTWTVTNYSNEYKYINPTEEELKDAILEVI